MGEVKPIVIEENEFDYQDVTLLKAIFGVIALSGFGRKEATRLLIF